MIKHLTSVLLIFTMLCMVFPAASFAGKPDEEWIVYTSGNGNAELTEDCATLDVTTEPGQSGVARVKKTIETKGNSVYFSVVFEANANEESGFYPDRTIYISDNSENPSELKKASVLACVSGGDLLGGMDYADMQRKVSYGQKHLLCGAVDMTEESIDLWLDGEYAGKTTLNLSGLPTESDLCLIFENTYPTNKKKALSSQFKIYDVCDSAVPTPEITVHTEDFTNYYVVLGTIASSAKLSVADAGEYTAEFTGGGFNVTFEEALDENKTYALTVSDILTLDGKEHSAEYIINKKECSLKLPDSASYSSSELTAFKAEVTGDIQKVSYYADGKFTASAYAPYEVDLSELSFGTHTVTASALSADGELVYDKCNITVAEKYEDNKFTYDFESFDDGAVSVGSSNRVVGANEIYTSHNVDGKYIISGEAGDHPKALIFGYDGENSTTGFTAACLSISNAKVGFESDVYFYDTNSNVTLFLRGQNSNGETVFPGNIIFAPNGDKTDIQAYDGQVLKTVSTLETKTWYSISYEFDLKNQKYSFYLNGEKLADNFAFNLELTTLGNMVRFHTVYKANSPSKMAIDNVSLSVISESMSIEPGEAMRGDESVALIQSGVYSELKSDPKVTQNGREIAVKAWKLTNGRLTLDFENPLMQTGRYDVSLDADGLNGGLKSYFDVISNTADISDISVFASEGICSVEFTRNEFSGGEDLIYIVNQYSDSKLVATYVEEVSDSDGKIKNISYEPGNTLKAFVLKKTPGAVPFSDVMVQTVLSE